MDEEFLKEVAWEAVREGIDDYRYLLAQAGFADVQLYPSLVGVPVDEESQSANLVIVGRKGPD